MLAHVATLWEVTLAADTGFLTPVIQDFTSTYLTQYDAIGLLVGTDYIIRATYFFDDGSNTGPGAATAFTTLAANTEPEPGSFEFATQGCGAC